MLMAFFSRLLVDLRRATLQGQLRLVCQTELVEGRRRNGRPIEHYLVALRDAFHGLSSTSCVLARRVLETGAHAVLGDLVGRDEGAEVGLCSGTCRTTVHDLVALALYCRILVSELHAAGLAGRRARREVEVAVNED